jgi:hypothetical protein
MADRPHSLPPADTNRCSPSFLAPMGRSRMQTWGPWQHSAKKSWQHLMEARAYFLAGLPSPQPDVALALARSALSAWSQ